MNDDDEKQTPLTNVEVVIHATDLDHSSSGWAGHITGVYQKRLRMKLFSSVQPSQLFGKDKIIADIILVSKRTVEEDYMPVYVLMFYKRIFKFLLVLSFSNPGRLGPAAANHRRQRPRASASS